MEVIRVKDYEEMTQRLLELFTDTIRRKPDCVLSFTTGATPKGLLEALAEQINQGLDISQCVFCNLDEYVGEKAKVYSVWHFMREYLYDRIRVQPREIHMFNGEAEEEEAELRRYQKVLEKYPRDLQLLGLGINGHIGANEPGTPFDSSVFVSDSRESTIEATQKLFGLTREEAPERMYTMGFREIMQAKQVVLAASGISKAEAVKKLLEGEITEEVPATCLRRHENCILIVDQEAASYLEKA